MGMAIKDEDVLAGSRPDALPPGCSLGKAQVVGRRVVMPMPKGTVVCLSDLATVDEDSFTAPAMRALWVSIGKVAGTGSLQPGVRVDVSVDTASVSRGEEETKAALKNVLVIAVDRKRLSKSQGKGLIIPLALLVSPDDAQKLIAANVHARIRLSKEGAL